MSSQDRDLPADLKMCLTTGLGHRASSRQQGSGGEGTRLIEDLKNVLSAPTTT
jgi:hypothetical protein